MSRRKICFTLSLMVDWRTRELVFDITSHRQITFLSPMADWRTKGLKRSSSSILGRYVSLFLGEVEDKETSRGTLES